MQDLRCKNINCNKLLAKVDTINGAIKCPRCGMLFEYKVFNNLFVTNQYDNSLHLDNKRSTIATEPTRSSVRSR